jgi:hypothetical protein
MQKIALFLLPNIWFCIWCTIFSQKKSCFCRNGTKQLCRMTFIRLAMQEMSGIQILEQERVQNIGSVIGWVTPLSYIPTKKYSILLFFKEKRIKFSVQKVKELWLGVVWERAFPFAGGGRRERGHAPIPPLNTLDCITLGYVLLTTLAPDIGTTLSSGGWGKRRNKTPFPKGPGSGQKLCNQAW